MLPTRWRSSEWRCLRRTVPLPAKLPKNRWPRARAMAQLRPFHVIPNIDWLVAFHSNSLSFEIFDVERNPHMGMFKLKGFMGWSYNMSPSCHMRFPHPWFVLTAHCQSGFCSSPQIGIYIRCICIRCICNIWVKGWTTFIQWHKPKEKKTPKSLYFFEFGMGLFSPPPNCRLWPRVCAF